MQAAARNQDIDYGQMIFYQKFQKIEPAESITDPILKLFWVVSINPKQSSLINKLIKEEFSYTSDYLKHLKRFQKNANGDKHIVLRVVLCPFEDMDFTCLRSLVGKKLKVEQEEVKLEKLSIPMNKPLDKLVNSEWSERYWPLVWKGNPLVQELNESFRNFNKERDLEYIKQVIKKSQTLQKEEPDKLPIVAMFVDPTINTVKSLHSDSRTDEDPINHPIMQCINEIAQDELQRRQLREQNNIKKNNTEKLSNFSQNNNYLCLNAHVYTTHEPCVMCCMALLHSRIDKLIYVNPSLLTGGIGSDSGCGYMVHYKCDLNWKFEAFRYLGNDDGKEVVPEVDCFLNI